MMLRPWKVSISESSLVETEHYTYNKTKHSRPQSLGDNS